MNTNTPHMAPTHRVRSPHCPNAAPASIAPDTGIGRCGSCAWGFTTPGHGIVLPDDAVVDTEETIGYQSDCGDVRIVFGYVGDNPATLGALRNGRFYPVLSERPATHQYLRRSDVRRVTGDIVQDFNLPSAKEALAA